jgi:hypothetical protein
VKLSICVLPIFSPVLSWAEARREVGLVSWWIRKERIAWYAWSPRIDLRFCGRGNYLYRWRQVSARAVYKSK